MGQIIGKLRARLAGKKTYLAGGALIAVAGAGVWTGHMGAFTAASVAGYGLSLLGMAAKSNRQHKQLLLAIETAGVLGMAMRTGGVGALIAAGEQEAPKILAACTEDPGT